MRGNGEHELDSSGLTSDEKKYYYCIKFAYNFVFVERPSAACRLVAERQTPTWSLPDLFQLLSTITLIWLHDTTNHGRKKCFCANVATKKREIRNYSLLGIFDGNSVFTLAAYVPEMGKSQGSEANGISGRWVSGLNEKRRHKNNEIYYEYDRSQDKAKRGDGKGNKSFLIIIIMSNEIGQNNVCSVIYSYYYIVLLCAILHFRIPFFSFVAVDNFIWDESERKKKRQQQTDKRMRQSVFIAYVLFLLFNFMAESV